MCVFCNDFSITKVCVKLVGNYPGNICLNKDHKKFELIIMKNEQKY